MKIYYPSKSGRGMSCSMYGKGRSVHRMKRGGSTPLLLVPNLGASEGMRNGNGIPSMTKVEQQKPQMNEVIRKLEDIQIQANKGVKRKNISFKL